MKSVRDAGSELNWIHPDVTRRHYELRAGDETIASLTWDAPDGSIATAKSGESSWTFRRLGFLNPHVVALEPGSGKQVFRFDATMSGGGLAQADDGHHFRWYANLWRAEWGWMDTAEKDLVKFRRSFDVDEKQEGKIEVLDLARDNPRLDLLIVLGWYLIIMVADLSAE